MTRSTFWLVRFRRLRRRDPGFVRALFLRRLAWALARPCFTDRRPRHRYRLIAVRDHAKMNHSDIQPSGFTGFRQNGFSKFLCDGQVEFTKAQLRLHHPPGGHRLRKIHPNGFTAAG